LKYGGIRATPLSLVMPGLDVRNFQVGKRCRQSERRPILCFGLVKTQKEMRNEGR
jgi:hypothetical protein